MTETDATETALSLIALYAEGRTNDVHALLNDTLSSEERGFVFLALIVVSSRFTRLLLEFNGVDTDEVMPEWLRTVARSATDYRP